MPKFPRGGRRLAVIGGRAGLVILEKAAEVSAVVAAA